MVACGLQKLCSELDVLSSSSLEDTSSFRLHLKSLENEKEKYQEDDRSKPYNGSKVSLCLHYLHDFIFTPDILYVANLKYLNIHY